MAKLKFIIFFMTALIIFANFNCEASKRTVAILPIDSVSNDYNISSIMAEHLTVSLHDSGSYILVERAELGQVMKEGGFQHSGAVDMSSAIELGKLAGAKYSLLGKITHIKITENPNYKYAPPIKLIKKSVDKFKARVTMVFRLVDNETGKDIIVSSVDATQTGDDKTTALHNTCVEVAKKVLEDLQQKNPFTAKILEVENDTIYIDQGFDSGLKVGDILNIAREGSPIMKDGVIIAVRQNFIGNAKVIEVNEEYSICKIISHTQAIKKGDVVKRVQKK